MDTLCLSAMTNEEVPNAKKTTNAIIEMVTKAARTLFLPSNCADRKITKAITVIATKVLSSKGSNKKSRLPAACFI